MSIITELVNSFKQTGTRMVVLDVRGNILVDDDHSSNRSLEKTIRALERSFVDKILYDKEES